MSIAKVIEVMGSSEKSWEDAVENALKETSKTIENIVGVDIIGYSATVKNNKIVEYKADVKIAFTVER